MTETVDDIMHGLFTTACEGGINYWASVDAYRWSKDGDGETEDLKGFKAVISDAEDEGFGGDEGDELTIDRAVIAKGLARFIARAWGPAHESYQGRFAAAARKRRWDDCDYDAETADMVVQLGLFGEVRFG